MPLNVEPRAPGKAHGAPEIVQLGSERPLGSPFTLSAQAAALTARAEHLRREAAGLDVRAIACRLALQAESASVWRAVA